MSTTLEYAPASSRKVRRTATLPEPAVRPKRLAYLVNQYPMVSHTFIRREIAELERRGFDIHRLSIRSTKGLTVDPADKREAERTFTCLDEPKALLLLCFVGYLLRHPVRMFRALRETERYSRTHRRNFGKHMAYLVEAVRLVRLLRKRGIDHVHAHFGTNSATVAVLMKKLAGIRFSMTVHGSAELDSPLTIRLPAKVAEAEFTAAISHYTKAQLMRYCAPRDWDRIHVVPCTIDDSYLSEALPIPTGSQGLVSVGRLSPEKGHLLLLDAFAEAIADGTPGKLAIVGDGPMRAEIEKKVAKLGLGNDVLLLGWQNEEQIKRHLRASKGLVLPSFYEGLPVVLMEAMALGRPVIATPVGGIPELVKDGENGWLVPAGDTHEWALAIRGLLRLDVPKCERIGRNGRRAIQASHAASVAGDKLEKLFTNLLNGRK